MRASRPWPDLRWLPRLKRPGSRLRVTDRDRCLRLSTTTIPRRLQPRLRRRHVLLEGHDVLGVLEREPDVVEPFEEPHAVGRRDVEFNVRAAWSADRLRLEIDRE